MSGIFLTIQTPQVFEGLFEVVVEAGKKLCKIIETVLVGLIGQEKGVVEFPLLKLGVVRCFKPRFNFSDKTLMNTLKPVGFGTFGDLSRVFGVPDLQSLDLPS